MEDLNVVSSTDEYHFPHSRLANGTLRGLFESEIKIFVMSRMSFRKNDFMVEIQTEHRINPLNEINISTDQVS